MITSPYNALLATSRLIESADCVLPVENQALGDIVKRVEEAEGKSLKTDITGDDKATKRQAFDKMNNIVAMLLSSLTCSMRFEGSLNVDLNEICMNLVPYPKLHFLSSALSPL